MKKEDLRIRDRLDGFVVEEGGTKVTRLEDIHYFLDQLVVVVQQDVGFERSKRTGFLRGDMDREVVLAPNAVHTVPAWIKQEIIKDRIRDQIRNS